MDLLTRCGVLSLVEHFSATINDQPAAGVKSFFKADNAPQ